MRNYATRKIAPFPVDVPYGSYRAGSVIEEDNDRDDGEIGARVCIKAHKTERSSDSRVRILLFLQRI